MGDDIVDEEEMLFFQSIKERKETYKQSFEERKMLKSEIDYLEKALETLRQSLVADFQAYYDERYMEEEDNRPTQSSRSSRYRGLDQEGKEDVLDEGEKFEKLQIERLQQEDPESLNYYLAYKKASKVKKSVNRRQ